MRKRSAADGPEPEGFLLLRKRPGLSSFASLSLVKKALGTGRVGHSGTLDSFAEGLLVVLVGRMTRLVPWFTGCDKRYVALARFGAETDTLDPEGPVIGEGPIPDEKALRASLGSFIGPQQQKPPVYSSVHVDGRRAHELARSGVEVEMKARPITIYGLDLLSYSNGEARLDIRCSKGTYIRSLARDLALACASRGHLRELLRTEVAGFKIEEATDPLAFEDPLEAVRGALRPIDADAFSRIGVAVRVVPPNRILDLAHGKALDTAALDFPEADSVALFSEAGRFLAIMERQDGTFRYGFVAIRPEEL